METDPVLAPGLQGVEAHKEGRGPWGRAGGPGRGQGSLGEEKEREREGVWAWDLKLHGKEREREGVWAWDRDRTGIGQGYRTGI